jgi:hypothetical protein
MSAWEGRWILQQERSRIVSSAYSLDMRSFFVAALWYSANA